MQQMVLSKIKKKIKKHLGQKIALNSKIYY